MHKGRYAGLQTGLIGDDWKDCVRSSEGGRIPTLKFSYSGAVDHGVGVSEVLNESPEVVLVFRSPPNGSRHRLRRVSRIS
jgi:hypothetical protein